MITASVFADRCFAVTIRRYIDYFNSGRRHVIKYFSVSHVTRRSNPHNNYLFRCVPLESENLH
jgi:hypothetical protein